MTTTMCKTKCTFNVVNTQHPQDNESHAQDPYSYFHEQQTIYRSTEITSWPDELLDLDAPLRTFSDVDDNLPALFADRLSVASVLNGARVPAIWEFERAF